MVSSSPAMRGLSTLTIRSLILFTLISSFLTHSHSDTGIYAPSYIALQKSSLKFNLSSSLIYSVHNMVKAGKYTLNLDLGPRNLIFLVVLGASGGIGQVSGSYS